MGSPGHDVCIYIAPSQYKYPILSAVFPKKTQCFFKALSLFLPLTVFGRVLSVVNVHGLIKAFF